MYMNHNIGNQGVEVATEWLFCSLEENIEKQLEELHLESPKAEESSDSEKLCLVPKRVHIKYNVAKIASGSFHNVAVADNAVYSWGKGGEG